MLHYTNFKSTHKLLHSINYSSNIISNLAASSTANTSSSTASSTTSTIAKLVNTLLLSNLKYQIPPAPSSPVSHYHNYDNHFNNTLDKSLNNTQYPYPYQYQYPNSNTTPTKSSDPYYYPHKHLNYHEKSKKLEKLISSHGMESNYLNNLIGYQPNFYQNQHSHSVWHKLPVFRRSAVLILLFLGKSGELRVILTKRSNSLRSFGGHIAFPGGKADKGLESDWQVARREAEEEIGINRNNQYLQDKFGFQIEYIKSLPSYLSRTFLAVAPCVGFINWTPEKLAKIEEQHISNIILNPGESSSIFSVPLKDFLQPKPRKYELQECLKQSYVKTRWGGIPWNLRSFIFPLHNDKEVKWLDDVQDLSSEEEETQTDMELGEKTRNVWGLTANILHDLAEIIYMGPKSYSKIIGEEDLIWSLLTNGNQMSTPKRSDFERSMISNSKDISFGQALNSDEFQKLKNLYSNI